MQAQHLGHFASQSPEPRGVDWSGSGCPVQAACVCIYRGADASSSVSREPLGQALDGYYVLSVEPLGRRRLGAGNFLAQRLIAIGAEREPVGRHVQGSGDVRQGIDSRAAARLDEVDHRAVAAGSVADLALSEPGVVAKTLQAVCQTLPKRIFPSASHVVKYTDGVYSQFFKNIAVHNSFY